MSGFSPFALAIGTGTQDRDGNWLEVYFPSPQLHPDPKLSTQILTCLDANPTQEWYLVKGSMLRQVLPLLKQMGLPEIPWTNSANPVVIVLLANDAPPQSVPGAYLKLHLLSHRLCSPNSINLDGIFSVLPTIAWTSAGACATSELQERIIQSRVQGVPLKTYSVDKFPPMTDYVVPGGVRIADTARVRLGAWIGEGTTIMHEGFVNFNAGTEGPNMIEGRISAGVHVARDSDLGGGSSTMGTLSGGNKTLISVGRNCLIGANAGTGIVLGDGCTIEAGLYLTGTSIVNRIDTEGKVRGTLKAYELSGEHNLLFRRNSISGTIEALPNKRTIALNQDLHSHN
jgi:2,3,4,5-tetrahydropyridine-2-carboxylate N-succinyltransferase